MTVNGSIWNECRRLAVVLAYESEEQFRMFRKALDAILNESQVQFLRIFIVLPGNQKKEDLQQHKLFVYLSSKDMGFLGKIKDDTLLESLSLSFDLLIQFGEVDNRSKKLLSRLNARVKTGCNAAQENFEITLETGSLVPAEMTNFVKTTLEKITNHE